MDSVIEHDPTLPLDLEKSTTLARFKEAMASGGLDPEMLDSTTLDSADGAASSLPEGKNGPVSPKNKTMKDYEFQISELKKENFGLKLRIYFLEERLANDDTPDDLFKANIELKVTVEKQKKELVEKQELLVKASNAVEMIANHSEEQIKQMREEHNEELQEIREGYENKVKEIEKEMAEAKQDVEDLAERLTEAVNMNQQLNEKLLESTGGFQDDQQQLQIYTKETLNEKDKMIDDLNDAFEVQKQQNEELQERADRLEKEKQKAQDDLRKLVEGEKKMKKMLDEMNKRSKAFEDVKEKARKLEKLNRDLRNKLHEKEREQHTSQSPVKAEMLAKTKIEDLEHSLAAARESAHTAKMKWYQTFEEHAEVIRLRDASIASLQNTLGTKDAELQKLMQLVSSKDLELQRLMGSKQLLENRLDDNIRGKNKELAELANKLKALSHEYSEKVDSLEEHYRQVVSGAQEQVSNKDKIIEKLAASNTEKDRIIEDFAIALKDISADTSTADASVDVRDELMKKLQNHMRQKDRAVESAISDKFRCLEEKDAELQQLRQALRERDRLIEKINSAVMSAEEQLKLLQTACDEKEQVIQALKTTNIEQENAHKNVFNNATQGLHEKEAMLQNLTRTLENRERELADLKEFVKELTHNTTQPDPEQSIRSKGFEEELKAKQKLIEELLSERTRMSSAHEANNQRLMDALQDKDNQIKDTAENLLRVQAEKNATIQRLQQLLNSRDHEIQSLENSKAWATQEHDMMTNKLRQALDDKDKAIQDLVQSSREKDEMLMKLQDSFRTPKKAPNTPEVNKMRRTIADLEESLKRKSESLRKLEEEYQANMKNSQNEVENMESKMKIENLEHELQTKDALLKQTQVTVRNLRAKTENLPIIEDLKQKFSEQSQAYLAAQKAKEQAMRELASVQRQKLESEAELKAKHDNIELLTQAAQVKDGVIREMQDSQKRQLHEMQENIGYYQKKAYDHEMANDALRQQLSESTELNNSLQRQLETLRNNFINRSPSRHDLEELARLREEVTSLRTELHRPTTPHRETSGVGTGRDEQGLHQLQRALADQVSETAKLNEILRREREMYINVVQHMRNAPSDPNHSITVTRELQTLKALRTQLEEGIRQINVLRAQLQSQCNSPASGRQSTSPHAVSPYDAVYQREIQELKSKLEDSERWNTSLQARLNELQPRVSGVGGSQDVIDRGREVLVSPEAVKNLNQQLSKLTSQLQQSTQLNQRLKNDLESMRSTTSNKNAEQESVIQNQAMQITNLQEQLNRTKQTFTELESRLTDADSKLEYYARNVNVDFEELLMEREQEVDSLRTKLNELKLREESVGPNYSRSDMAIQTTPGRDWGQGSVETQRQAEENLRQELDETKRWSEQCKKLLDEKVQEIQQLKQKNAVSRRAESPEKTKEKAELQRLRNEYEKGIRTNEELKRQLEGELDSISTREKAMTTDARHMTELREKLDESLRVNDSLQDKLRDSLHSERDVEHVRRELSSANKTNESLALQIQDLHQSIQRFGSISDEAERLRSDLRDAHALNENLSQQLQETRRSAEEAGHVNKELRQAKLMNEQLGKQLAELLNHLSKFKVENERLRSELDQKIKSIEGLEERLSCQPPTQSRGVSPLAPLSIITSSTPHLDFAATQTSPGLGLASPHSVTRLSSPRSVSSQESPVMEKMHKLNKTLMSENQFLRNKLKQNERFNITLKEELDMYHRMRRDSIHSQTSSSPTRSTNTTGSSNDQLLTTYMSEMRALRLRLEESIRTNDALKAQLQRRISEEGRDGHDQMAMFVSDKALLCVRFGFSTTWPISNITLKVDMFESDKVLLYVR
ncbi:myomegalin isoform X2 [Nematostella vectensis]|uniref:myomegalin isoform X2 n=1 Tax=Nematostella vectensis TaxID=45351 RepID=UPI002076F10D|nr:myomegalin isoform X2 [Nematostella vectensis]